MLNARTHATNLLVQLDEMAEPPRYPVLPRLPLLLRMHGREDVVAHVGVGRTLARHGALQDLHRDFDSSPPSASYCWARAHAPAAPARPGQHVHAVELAAVHREMRECCPSTRTPTPNVRRQRRPQSRSHRIRTVLVFLRIVLRRVVPWGHYSLVGHRGEQHHGEAEQRVLSRRTQSRMALVACS